MDNIFDEIGSALSQPKKQVRIETMLVDKALGDAMERTFETSIGAGDSLGGITPEILLKNGTLGLNFKLFEDFDISKILDTIINTSNAEITGTLTDGIDNSDIISSPSVVAMSGEEASILIGNRIPFIVKDIEYVDGNPVEVERIEYLNTGVELIITPVVNDDGKIFLDLFVKVSEFETYSDVASGRTLYGEKTRETTTRLVIDNGNTLTIGGLVTDKEEVKVDKMPFLSDLPFIGKLFTSEKKTTEKRELVIFITAEVVEP